MLERDLFDDGPGRGSTWIRGLPTVAFERLMLF